MSTDAPVRRRRFPVPWLLALGLIALVLASYGVFQGQPGPERCSARFRPKGSNSGGSIPEEAEAVLVDLEANLAETPAAFTVGGTEVQITPASLGFDLDEAGHGRAGQWRSAGRATWWANSGGGSPIFSPPTISAAPPIIDADAVEAVMTDLGYRGDRQPAVPGRRRNQRNGARGAVSAGRPAGRSLGRPRPHPRAIDDL